MFVSKTKLQHHLLSSGKVIKRVKITMAFAKKPFSLVFRFMLIIVSRKTNCLKVYDKRYITFLASTLGLFILEVALFLQFS